MYIYLGASVGEGGSGGICDMRGIGSSWARDWHGKNDFLPMLLTDLSMVLIHRF